eukprot:GHVT01012032.1.p1 GENE.GHVT01012032.1~~GHVT01012032.1.p1  ORF type:complete len:257 (+),score=56.32 GHVT01012032.1:241-1011(+)
MYEVLAGRLGWTFDVVEVNKEEGAGGIRHAAANVEGLRAFGYLQHECGVHRVQRIPATDPQGRMQTSTATVTVLPSPPDNAPNITFAPGELKFETMRWGGPGGQSANKSESAVRLTHTKSGLVVCCCATQNQTENKKRALATLSARLYAAKSRRLREAAGEAKHAQAGSGDRSGKCRTYNFARHVVVDHRLARPIGDVSQFVREAEGLEELLAALWEASRSRELDALLRRLAEVHLPGESPMGSSQRTRADVFTAR